MLRAVQDALKAQQAVIPAVERRVRREGAQQRGLPPLRQGRGLPCEGFADAETAVFRRDHDGVDIADDRGLPALAHELKAV